MAATPLLGLTLPTTGTLSGTWGETVNNEITSLIDSAVAGTTTLSTDADVTLTTTASSANQAREAILSFTGARTALRTIIAPAQSKTYVVYNQTSGGFSVKLAAPGPTTGVTILNGETAVVAWNGADFARISTLGGPITGSTGVFTGTVSGTTGTFSGAVSGTTGTFTGNVQMPSANGGQLAGLRNRIINGSFDIWQRGTSFAAAASIVYTADRWAFYRSALATGATAAQTTPTGITGSSSYGIRVQRNSGNASVDPLVLSQCIETQNARVLQGQAITVSFKQRTGANISAATILVTLTYGTGTDQGVNAARAGSWTGQGTLSGSFNTGSTTFTATSIQYSIPSTATELQLNFAYTPTGTAGAADYFDIADVQLEIGPVATPFEQISYGLSLQLCQRYYCYIYVGFRFNSGPVSPYQYGWTISLPVSMRTTPITIALGGTPTIANLTSETTGNLVTLGTSTISYQLNPTAANLDTYITNRLITISSEL